MPNFSRRKSESMKTMKVYLFDSSSLGKELRILKDKGSSENYGILHSEHGDYTFACINTANN